MTWSVKADCRCNGFTYLIYSLIFLLFLKFFIDHNILCILLQHAFTYSIFHPWNSACIQVCLWCTVILDNFLTCLFCPLSPCPRNYNARPTKTNCKMFSSSCISVSDHNSPKGGLTSPAFPPDTLCPANIVNKLQLFYYSVLQFPFQSDDSCKAFCLCFGAVVFSLSNNHFPFAFLNPLLVLVVFLWCPHGERKTKWKGMRESAWDGGRTGTILLWKRARWQGIKGRSRRGFPFQCLSWETKIKSYDPWSSREDGTVGTVD